SSSSSPSSAARGPTAADASRSRRSISGSDPGGASGIFVALADARSSHAPTATTAIRNNAPSMGALTARFLRRSELGALVMIAEHFAHRVPDFAFSRVRARAVEDALHQIVLAGCGARRRGQIAERGRARLVVAGAAQLGQRLPLLDLDLLRDGEDRD